MSLKFTPEAQKVIDEYRERMHKINEIRAVIVEAMKSGDHRTALLYLDKLKSLSNE